MSCPCFGLCVPLPRDARERDVEKFFRGFGRIREINLKNGFGFVVSTEFESVLKSPRGGGTPL